MAFHMTQTAIPYVFMRGGTSRGPYFNSADLPSDRETLAEVLLSVVGSGHPLNIDGIGGGNAVTTKVAMLSRSEDPWADIDYFFAQVSVEDRLVDFKPTCGNILSGVASAAIEMGLIHAQEGSTQVNIRAVNTGAKVAARVQRNKAAGQTARARRFHLEPGAISCSQVRDDWAFGVGRVRLETHCRLPCLRRAQGGPGVTFV